MDILVERADGVLTIAFNRPDKKDAMTAAMYQTMADALVQAQGDAAVRAILIRGGAGIFSAGNDLEDFMKTPPMGENAPVFQFLRAISSAEKPVVASVAGPAVGIGTTLLTTGLAFFLYRMIFGQPAVPPNVVAFAPVPVPLLSAIPIIGPIFFNQAAITYLALLSVPLTWLALHRTRWGLNLRTVGENPRAADTAGVSVWSMRIQALVLSGALMGLGGAYLTISQFNAFTFGVISGRGWVCIALVVFGQWLPWRCAAGVLLFAMIEALQLRLQANNTLNIPYEVFLMLPFVMTILAMALVSRNANAPASLLIPFRKEER